MLGIAAGYGLIALVALIQLARIQMRVPYPEYGWTTQKVFHLLNFLVAGLRAVVCVAWDRVQAGQPPMVHAMLLDLPGLLFFSTYTLLLLFWVEIYHQARGLPTSTLGPCYFAANIGIFAIQTGLWAFGALAHGKLVEVCRAADCIFQATVSLAAALGFLVFGSRLFLLLQRFPESRGRTKKLREIGILTPICATSFTLRAVIVAWSGVDKVDAGLDFWQRNMVYYAVVEILPSAMVLFILRKLPPRPSQHSH